MQAKPRPSKEEEKPLEWGPYAYGAVVKPLKATVDKASYTMEKASYGVADGAQPVIDVTPTHTTPRGLACSDASVL